MDISPKSTADDNRRSCVRFNTLKTDDRVMLSDGVTRITARCTDRSAEGFGFCCEAKIPWTIGQTILLRREEESYEVRIANISERDGQERIGVQRVRDFVAAAELTRLHTPWEWLRKPVCFRGQNDLWVFGLGLSGLVCAAVLAFMFLPHTAFRNGKRPVALHNSHTQANPLSHVSNASTGAQEGAERSPSTELKGSQNRAGVSADGLWDEIVSGTREVTWPDVEVLLSLTREQSQKLLALLNQEFSEVSSKTGNSSAPVADSRAHLASLIESLPEKALSFLDDKQRAKLKSLLILLSQPKQQR